MQNWALLVAVAGVAFANLPAVMQQWRSDRAGPIKPLEFLAVYLIYCLIGGGLILWLASRAHRRGQRPEDLGETLSYRGQTLRRAQAAA
jgi:drug/metabolite transporter (DMT)-like permease